MQNFITNLQRLTTHKDRYIKGASIQLLNKLQEITEYLDTCELCNAKLDNSRNGTTCNECLNSLPL